jgi:hypothetical protein
MYKVSELPDGIILWVNGEYTAMIFHSFVAVMGIFGHLLIFLCHVPIATNIQPNLILTMSLVLADLVFLLDVLVVNVFNLRAGGFSGGSSMCMIGAALTLLSGFASVFTLLSSTLERYLHIVHQKEVSKRQACLWVVAIWVGAFIASCFPIFFGAERDTYGLNSGLTHCVLAWWAVEGPGSSFTLFTCTAVLVTFLLCSGVMVYCYFNIVSTYISARKSVASHSHVKGLKSSVVDTWGKSIQETKEYMSGGTAESASTKQPKPKQANQQRILLTKAIVLTASFFVMWTPYFLKVSMID